MFNTTIPILDAAGATKNFVLQSTAPQGGGSQRIDNSTSMTEPQLFVIRHQAVGPNPDSPVNPDGQDRHNLLWTRDKRTASGALHRASLSVVITVSRNAVITPAMVNDLVAFERNFLGVAANVTSLLLNEA